MVCKTYPRIMAIACAVAVAGCVSSEKYPESWEPLPQNPTDCPTIAGVYLDEGASALREPVPSLSYIFDGNRREHLYSHTSIEQPDKGTLVLHFWTNGSIARSKVLHRSSDDFKCTEGRLVFSRGEPAIGGGGFVVMVAGQSFHFEVTPTPQALIVQRKEMSGGVVAPFLLPIPMVVAGNNWYRYERSQPPVGSTREQLEDK